MKIKKTVAYPVVTIEEFLNIVRAGIMEDFKNYSKEVIINYLFGHGAVKFDKDHVNEFLKGLPVFVCMPSVLLDFGDASHYWMVAGNSAIIVDKP